MSELYGNRNKNTYDIREDNGIGDLAVVANRTNESGPSIQCPMLNTNYTVWSMRMKVMLKVHKVWETIESGAADGDRSDMAHALLFQSILEAMIQLLLY